MNNYFMDEAIKEASKGINKKHGGPFGAVIIKDNKIIARGHNRVIKNNDPTAHAEIAAIRSASKKLKKYNLEDCILYTTCEPCPMCYSAIHWARIKTIYYGCSRNDAADIGFDDKLIYEELKGNIKDDASKKQIMREDCLKVFKKWNNKNKIIY